MIKRQRDYPKDLLIGDIVWRIRFCRRVPEATVKNQVGSCDPSTETIWIRLGQTPEERFKTLVHEVLHAIEHAYQIDIPHRLISKLEEPLSALIRENLGVAA